jgi:glycosyltransferase involved in cell wall biosynthesis
MKHNENGFCVPVGKGEVETMADRIRTILEDDKMRDKMSKRSRELSLQFDRKRTGKAYSRILSELR